MIDETNPAPRLICHQCGSKSQAWIKTKDDGGKAWSGPYCHKCLSVFFSAFVMRPSKCPDLKDAPENIEDLPMTVRLQHYLGKAGITKTEVLLHKTKWEILRLEGIGQKSLQELTYTLDAYGLKLREVP